jgi:hypothetical protein
MTPMPAMTSRTVLQLNAFVALVCVAAAAATISLVLTRPEAAAAAVAQHDYTAVATAIAREVGGWLRALLHFL